MAMTVNELIDLLSEVDEKDRDLPIEFLQWWWDEDVTEEMLSYVNDVKGDVLVTKHDLHKYQLQMKKEENYFVSEKNSPKTNDGRERNAVCLYTKMSDDGFYIMHEYHKTHADLGNEMYQDNDEDYKKNMIEFN